jgi:hypothetical protein
VLAFVGTLAAAQFAWIYAVAVQSNGLNLGPSVIPNIAFVVGILLYVVLRYEPGRRQHQKKPGRLAQFVTGEVNVRLATRSDTGEPKSGTMLNRNTGK